MSGVRAKKTGFPAGELRHALLLYLHGPKKDGSLLQETALPSLPPLLASSFRLTSM